MGGGDTKAQVEVGVPLLQGSACVCACVCEKGVHGPRQGLR